MARAVTHHSSETETRPAGAGARDDVARRRLRGAVLRELSATERLLVLLWYAERMSPGEVAMSLDLTLAQARAMHDRVVTRLRQALFAA